MPLATRLKDSTPAPSPAWAGYEAIGGRCNPTTALPQPPAWAGYEAIGGRTVRIGLILRIEITLDNIGNPR